MSVYHHIKGQLVVKEFFPTRSDFPEKFGFFCFHLVNKTHRDKIASSLQVSVWPSG